MRRRITEFLGITLPMKFTISDSFSGGTIHFERAFTLGGRDYYWCPDQSEIPAARSLAALAIYEEMKMGVNKEYIEKHCEEVKKILTPGAKLDLTRLVKLNENLADRSKLMVLPDYIYRLASVVFVEQSESPYSYDWKFNQRKIEHFRAHGDLAFFLTTPLARLIPFSKEQREDMQIYSQVAEQIDHAHWTFLMEP